MCKMLMTEKMANLNKTYKRVKKSKLKNSLWVNLVAGLTHTQISVKKYLKHGLTDTGIQLMLTKLFSESEPLFSESLWDPAVTIFAQGCP